MFNSISDAKLDANERYKAKNLDRYGMYMPRGRLQLVKAHAKQYQPEEGEPGKAGYSPRGSVNAFINRAICDVMERDVAASPAKPTAGTQETYKRLLADINRTKRRKTVTPHESLLVILGRIQMAFELGFLSKTDSDKLIRKCAIVESKKRESDSIPSVDAEALPDYSQTSL